VLLKLRLDEETADRLKLEAHGRKLSVSQVVAELIRSTPKRFVLVDRGAKGSIGPADPPLRAVSEDPSGQGASGTHGADSSAA